jgi:ABC-type lipoprotein release transport system permease subunit
MDPATSPRTDYFLKAIARLKPGVSVEQADAEMRAMLTQIHAEHRVSPLDPVSYAIAPLIFVATGCVAAYLPGRRATRVDPVIALRHD